MERAEKQQHHRWQTTENLPLTNTPIQMDGYPHLSTKEQAEEAMIHQAF